MLDLQLLRAFLAVAECGSFRGASERLNVTQSTVSQQIKRLEEELGRPLFRRTTRRVALNRGRDAHYCAPPAQNRTCGIPAYGSHLGCLTAKRCSGQG
jgi:predicted transcriptional regulator